MESIQKLLEEFVEDLKKEGRSSSTVVAYKNDLIQFFDYLAKAGKTDPTQVTRDDILQYMGYLEKQKNFEYRTVARKMNSIKSFFRFLQKKGVIDYYSSPMLGIKIPAPQDDDIRYLTKMEYLALKEATRVDPRVHVIFETLVQTGLRVGELVRLRLEDVKRTSKGNMYFEIRPYGNQPKRLVPIPKELEKLLEDYIKEYRPKVKEEEDSGYLFITRTGKPIAIRNVRSMLKRVMDELGIKDVTINDLRNTFIIYALKRGIDPLSVARVVGHKRLSSTERYLRFIEAQKKQEESSGSDQTSQQASQPTD